MQDQCLIHNVRLKNLQSQKKQGLQGGNEHFFDKRKAAGGHYGQPLIIIF